MFLQFIELANTFFIYYYSYYKCKEAVKYLCRGSIKIIGDNDKHLLRDHNHRPDPTVIAMNTFKETLKQRSIDEVTMLNTIYEDEAKQ